METGDSGASGEGGYGQAPVDGEERRRHPRAPISLLVQYRFESFENLLCAYSFDVSPGGLFLRTNEPCPVGAMIFLQFALEDGSKLIESLGRVVHVRQGGPVIPGMGVEFVDFDAASLKVMSNFVADRIRRTGPVTGLQRPATGISPVSRDRGRNEGA